MGGEELLGSRAFRLAAGPRLGGAQWLDLGRPARHDLQWVADITFGAGLVFVAITMAGDAMEAGSALDVVGLTPDPSAIRALTEGHAVMFGATGCVLLAVISGSSAYTVLASRALPRWMGVVAWVVAGLQIQAGQNSVAQTAQHRTAR